MNNSLNLNGFDVTLEVLAPRMEIRESENQKQFQPLPEKSSYSRTWASKTLAGASPLLGGDYE